MKLYLRMTQLQLLKTERFLLRSLLRAKLSAEWLYDYSCLLTLRVQIAYMFLTREKLHGGLLHLMNEALKTPEERIEQYRARKRARS